MKRISSVPVEVFEFAKFSREKVACIRFKLLQLCQKEKIVRQIFRDRRNLQNSIGKRKLTKI